jgi:hypothetical protein
MAEGTRWKAAMKEFSMSDKLWDLANFGTGFAILQTLATTFALVKGDLNVLKGLKAHRYVFIGTVIFLLLYLAAIFWCGYVGSSLDKPEDLRVWNYVTVGRLCSVLIFTLVMWVALLGHWRDEKKGPTPAPFDHAV